MYHHTTGKSFDKLFVAVTGKANSPDLYTVMQIIGKEKYPLDERQVVAEHLQAMKWR